MKHLLFLLIAALSTAIVFGQGQTINRPQTFTNQTWLTGVSAYSTGAYTKLVLNSTTNLLEYTPNTLLSGKVVAVTEKDSARNYTHTGSFLTYVKWTTRDTVNLANTAYFTNQIFKFTVIASGADTTVFIPASGTIDGATSYTMTGTHNSISWWYDGTNYWAIK